jgi:hypothetical protein
MKLRCLRCRVSWMPRIEGRPKWCPSCHSPYWDKERVRGVAVKSVAVVQVSRSSGVVESKKPEPIIIQEEEKRPARSSGCSECGGLNGLHQKGCKRGK